MRATCPAPVQEELGTRTKTSMLIGHRRTCIQATCEPDDMDNRSVHAYNTWIRVPDRRRLDLQGVWKILFKDLCTSRTHLHACMLSPASPRQSALIH
nr:hypothetical protein CFP56_20271 [Quercus suber]